MVFLDKKCVMLFTKNILTTFSNGCLGSRNDEERSEMRYVMRIAEYVNHQIFERKLRFRVLLEACLFQCLLTPLARVVSFFCRKECTTLWRTLMLASLTRMHSSM